MLDRHGNTNKGKLNIVEIQNPKGMRVYLLLNVPVADVAVVVAVIVAAAYYCCMLFNNQTVLAVTATMFNIFFRT